MSAIDYIEIMKTISQIAENEVKKNYDEFDAYQISIGINIMVQRIKDSEFLLKDLNK